MLVQRRMALENVIQLLTGGCRACGALMSGSLGSGNDPACCFYDAIVCSAGGYFLCNRRLESLLPPSFLSTACLNRLPLHACLPAVNMFEDVDPVAVLEKRVAGEEGGHTEWLVKFEDEEEVRGCGAGCKHRAAGLDAGWKQWGESLPKERCGEFSDSSTS